MLSQAKMVARRAIESQYDGLCDVLVRQKWTKPNGATSHRETYAYERQPCRVSFKAIQSAGDSATNGASPIGQAVTLFIAPELTIPAGAKIIVTQQGVTTAYTRSGIPAVYSTHQEISLELLKEWA